MGAGARGGRRGAPSWMPTARLLRVFHPVIQQVDVYANVGSNENIPFVVVVQSSVFEGGAVPGGVAAGR